MSTEKEIIEITNATAEVNKAFETLDFKNSADYLTDDIDYITFNGMHIKGKAEYVKVHEEMMHNFMFKGAKLYSKIEEIRFTNPQTAIVIAMGAIKFRWQKKAPDSRQSINTNVWIKDADGKWRLTAFHNCRVKKIGFFAKLMMKLLKTR